MQLHANVQAVQDDLDRADARTVPLSLPRSGSCPRPCTPPPRRPPSSASRCGKIANSLIFDADGAPLLVLTSGAHRVDTRRLAAALGLDLTSGPPRNFVREHRPAEDRPARRPIGHPGPVRSLADILPSREVHRTAGLPAVPQADLPTTYAEALRITAGTPADVA